MVNIIIHNAINAALDFFYPRKCMFCGKFERFDDIRLCIECKKAMEKIKPPYCAKCGRHIEADRTAGICCDCADRDFCFDRGGVLWTYEGYYARSVLDLKFKDKLENRKTIGALCTSDIMEKGLSADIDIIIPVPLHKRKMKKRGYNQAELLAAEIGGRLQIPVRADLLARVNMTAPQMDLSFDSRVANIKGAMKVLSPDIVEGKRILLIDDIFTTGSTLNECASELKKSAAVKVNCYCVCISYDKTR